MNKEEVDKFCEEYYGFTIDECDDFVGFWIDKYHKSEQENNQLKEQRQELRSWLEEDKDKINVLDAKNNGSVKLGIVIGLGMCLDKLNELEGGKNE